MINQKNLNRRQFIKNTIALSGTPLLTTCAARQTMSAADQVPLGKTGLKLSRLGFGTGTIGGDVQRDLGTDGFNRLLRYAYDQGITYIDTAQGYRTHTWVRDAIKGIPRENLFIQSKMGGTPDNPLELIDRYRKELGVDYIDSLLLHGVRSENWDDERKRIRDAFDEAKDKKIILSHGASFHSIHALTKGANTDWVDVSLVRINPQGINIDTTEIAWGPHSNISDVPAALEQIKLMKEKRQGVIGMKIIGEGAFTDPAEREKSIRFTMQSGLVDAVVIGFKNTAEIDEAVKNINNALTEMA